VNHLYGQLYDNTFTEQWNGGIPQGLFTEASNYTYQSAAEDGTGGVIVMALRSGDSRVYAKRFDDSGASPWGHAAGDTGTQVRAVAISDVSAVPVTTGTVVPVTSGTTEMGSLALSNPFFDDDVDLSGLDGEVIMDPVTHDGTTIVGGAAQDFIYIAGQVDNIIGDGDTYAIGSLTDSDSITAEDHEIRDTNPDALVYDYSSGTLPTAADFYSPHGFTLPVWLNAGDIVRRVASYGRLSAVNMETPILAYDTGIATGGGNTQLEDTTKTWTSWWGWWESVWVEKFIAIDDRVVNIDDSRFALVTWVTDTLLDIDPGPMSFNGGENYDIYIQYCNDHSADLNQFSPFYRFTSDWEMSIFAGTAFSVYDYTGPTGTAQAIPGNPLLDNEGNFNGTVNAGDVVINYTDDTFAAVSSAAYTHAMGLASGIMADGDVYEVVRIPSGGTGDIVSVGTTTGTTGGHLIDTSGGKNFITDGVSAGDRAYNLTDDTYATITGVAAQDLTLDTDIFTAGEHYIILQSGLLFIFQEGTNVRGRIMSMGGGGSPPVQITPPWTIYAGINPVAISDGAGNALLVYEDASTQVRAALLDGRGVPQWNTEIDIQAAVAESIVGVKSDGANGVVILYRYSDDLHAQRIDSTGTPLWGVNGIALDGDGAATVTSDESWEYIAPNDVLVVANAGNNIWARRATFGGAGWGPFTYTALGSTQDAPQLFLNGNETVILWEDNRFDNPPSGYIDTGWGVFGLMINAADGTTATAAENWRANTSGVDDYNGVSIILNSYNYLPSNPLVVPFNDGADARLVWEDYRAGTANDLLSIDLVSFTP
jgi:hypothetical protein